jgi:hypothetical protein
MKCGEGRRRYEEIKIEKNSGPYGTFKTGKTWADCGWIRMMGSGKKGIGEISCQKGLRMKNGEI